MTAPKKYRLVTRSDFDGLVCAMLLKELKLIDKIIFVHPKDMQDGKIPITENDITTNLPYVPGAYLVFDHHASEALRNAEQHPDNYILEPETPSAARVVYNYYGGKKTFPHVSEAMLIAVDKADSAKFSREEILFPKDWVLLNYIMDPRTGLGRYKNFRISNYDLMMLLIDDCKRYPIEKVLNLPDVRERVDLYFEHQRLSMDQIEQCAKIHGNAVVLDLRQQEQIYTVNRFIVYAMYPECNISIHIMWGLQKQNTVFAMGSSILNRSSKTHVGKLMLNYGGGGHEKAGTCQISNDRAEQVLAELIQQVNSDG